jgi:hypothetical protein
VENNKVINMKTTKMMEQIVRDMEFKTRWDAIFESELKRAGYFTLLQSDVPGAINRYGEVMHSSILIMTLSLVDEYSESIHDVHGLIHELIILLTSIDLVS